MFFKYPTIVSLDKSRLPEDSTFPKIEDEEEEVIQNRKAIKASQQRHAHPQTQPHPVANFPFD